MIRRLVLIELIELLADPLIWGGLLFVSALILTGLNQLDLDANRTQVLILDQSEGQEEGRRIDALVREIEGVIPIVEAPKNNVVELIDRINPSIILTRAEDRWQATLRSRSIIDHRRLARLGLMLATVINRQTPWDAIAGTDAFTASDYGKSACEIGSRICSVYRWTGHPKIADFCVTEAGGTDQLLEQQKTVCGSQGQVLGASVDFARAITAFCSSTQIQQEQKQGICPKVQKTSLLAVVGSNGDPDSHTRVFVPRTVALIVIFVAFVLGCRSIMNETRFNVLNSILAANHGKLASVVISKALVATIFSIALLSLLLLYSQIFFGLYIKPGILYVYIPLIIATTSSVALGIAISLVVKDEASIYLIGCVYLLLLFILSGYIDEIRDGNLAIWMLSYLLPLKYIMSDFSSWVIFGRPVGWESTVSLVAQCLGSLGLLALAVEYSRRSS